MAEPQPSNALSSAFPPPPPFWQSFTAENINRVEILRKEQPATQQDTTSSTASPQSLPQLPPRIPNLPSELRFLQPPVPPADGNYRCFGDSYDLNETLPTLEKQGIQQLYETPDDSRGDRAERASILKNIARQLLLKFLELIGVLSANPSLSKEYIDELRTLFINFHHLLNEYRPHQARESLIRLMEEQLERTKKETDDLIAVKEKVEGVIEGLAGISIPTDETSPPMTTSDTKVIGGEEVWAAIDKEFG